MGCAGALAGASAALCFCAKAAIMLAHSSMKQARLRIAVIKFLQRNKRTSLKARARQRQIWPAEKKFYFFLRDGLAGVSVLGCIPSTLSRTLSKASVAVSSFRPPWFLRYLCSLLQVRQRVTSTSSAAMETTE